MKPREEVALALFASVYPGFSDKARRHPETHDQIMADGMERAWKAAEVWETMKR